MPVILYSLRGVIFSRFSDSDDLITSSVKFQYVSTAEAGNDDPRQTATAQLILPDHGKVQCDNLESE